MQALMDACCLHSEAQHHYFSYLIVLTQSQFKGVSTRASRLQLCAEEKVMSGFDYLSLIKRQAKSLAKNKSIKLSAALASIASQGGFSHYHELQKVAAKRPTDPRLMRLALQTNNLDEVVFNKSIYGQIRPILENELSYYVAVKASGFSIDDLVVEEAIYDQSTGVLSTYADIKCVGTLKPGQPYSSTEFDLNVVIRLFRHVNHWDFTESDSFEITGIVGDQDLDALNADMSLAAEIAKAVDIPSLSDMSLASEIAMANMTGLRKF